MSARPAQGPSEQCFLDSLLYFDVFNRVGTGITDQEARGSRQCATVYPVLRCSNLYHFGLASDGISFHDLDHQAPKHHSETYSLHLRLRQVSSHVSAFWCRSASGQVSFVRCEPDARSPSRLPAPCARRTNLRRPVPSRAGSPAHCSASFRTCSHSAQAHANVP